MANSDAQTTNFARIRLEHGAAYPYDAGAEWWQSEEMTAPPLAEDWAHAAARGVLADLCDRRGIKHALQDDDVDHETRSELTRTMAAIIREAANVR